MFIQDRFFFSQEFKTFLKGKIPKFGFGGYGELVYLRTYSRIMDNGAQEQWSDTVIRVIEGAASITIDKIRKNKKTNFDKETLKKFFEEAAVSMFDMEWLPPGRGLWAGGTDFVFERGSAALNNCGFVDTSDKKTFGDAIYWMMDMLMCGVGIGFSAFSKNVLDVDSVSPNKLQKDGGVFVFEIPDTREGWAESVKFQVDYFFGSGTERKPSFDYSKIRPAGSRIKGFGGVASGPQPLKDLHDAIEEIHGMAIKDPSTFTQTRIVADVANLVGCCVVAGNVRRSAEIAIGDPGDFVFENLKNSSIYPERQKHSWMSNNSVRFSHTDQFDKYLPEIASRIIDNGEPGFVNLLNIQKYARYGKEKPDTAIGANPCSEIPLESHELCNLAEVFPTKFKKDGHMPFVYATWYATTISTLPTHSKATNEVIERNHRIGVSISGIADLLDSVGCTSLITRLRRWYKVVDTANAEWCSNFDIPKSIRITTVKPSGTISQLVGVSSGMHFPTFAHAIRRTRVGLDSPICDFLIRNGVPHEPDKYSKNTMVFSTPIKNTGSRPAQEVSAWEQMAFQAMLQREYADNMVSCTVYFDREKEAKEIERILANFAPVLKSTSLLPHTEQGVYEQMPYEGISEEKYASLCEKYPKIDWSSFCGSDGMDTKFCSNDSCELNL